VIRLKLIGLKIKNKAKLEYFDLWHRLGKKNIFNDPKISSIKPIIKITAG
jgi:hypothetical protein